MQPEHYRIRIVDFGGDGNWRWHRDRAVVATFRTEAAAREKIGTVEAFLIDSQATAEVVKIPAGTKRADTYLGNTLEND